MDEYVRMHRSINRLIKQTNKQTRVNKQQTMNRKQQTINNKHQTKNKQTIKNASTRIKTIWDFHFLCLMFNFFIGNEPKKNGKKND